MNPHPTAAELAFLNLAYPRFQNLFDEVMGDALWAEPDWIRFSKFTAGFSIYAELLKYEPIKAVISEMKTHRPPMESEISSALFKFVRNLVSHFPVFERWDDVWCSEEIVTWEQAGSIHNFLKSYVGKPEVKYRFWNPEKKEMTYLSIRFPSVYGGDHKIYLKDIITEREGIKFCYILMNQILSTQITE